MRKGCFVKSLVLSPLPVLAAVLLGMSWVQAQAQTSSREVLLGVSKVGQSAVSPAIAEQDAKAQYDSANSMMRRGQAAAGQRQLEQLVANYPDSEAADRARQDLVALYGGTKSNSAFSGESRISYLGRPEAQAPAAPSAISAWRTTVRPSGGARVTPQEDLRASAGDLVFFSEGSAELGARARKALSAQAAWLVRNGDRAVLVEGHADGEGSASEQRALSLARAEAVRSRLVEEGVEPVRIRVVGHAADRRVALCADLSCASQNRRAATTIGGAADAHLSPR